MDRRIPFTRFVESDCTVDRAEDAFACTLRFPADRDGYFLAPLSELGETAWNEARWIWFDAVNHGPHSLTLALSFWEGDLAHAATATPTSALSDEPASEAAVRVGLGGGKPHLACIMGLLPGVPTRVSLPLAALDAQQLFLPRTPGKLKTVLHGNRVVRPSHLSIGHRRASSAQQLTLSNLHLSADEPAYPLEAGIRIDELGQWSESDWPGKTSSRETLVRSLQTSLAACGQGRFFEGWTPSGGWQAKRFDETGWFRTQHDGTRWWLAAPDGHAFFSAGVDCVNPGDSMNTTGILPLCGALPDREGPYADAWVSRQGPWRADLYSHAIANLIHAFGDNWRDAWTRLTAGRLRDWGFNTVGNWSSQPFAVASGLPWVYPMRDFPTTKTRLFRDFPDVFSPEYETAAEAYASQMLPLAADRNLIGYFLRNEPEWAFVHDLDLAEELLETDFPSHSRDALASFLAQRYDGRIERLNAVWGAAFDSFEALRAPVVRARRFPGAIADLSAFSRQLVDRYVRIPSEAVRRVDPNHLNLGMRYAFLSSADLLAGSDCFDVFSINCYDVDPREAIGKAGRATGLPVMIGEFHFGALDRGLSATGIRGAADQTERGIAYRSYVDRAAASPFCVGAHYFQYCDQPALGRFDGENYNIGLVDVCQTPHDAFLDGVRACHRDLYRVAAGGQEPQPREPRLIHPIFY